MSKSTLRIPPEFGEATTAERIAFVTRLWDEIVESGEEVPVPDHHKAILDERLRAYRANPKPGRPWSEVRDEILSRLRSS
jgi:putative addiction module component (TIGR02574 family)